MRYLLFLGLLVLTLPVLGYNEVISAISYNPSRLGAYTHLKAVEKAILAGGLLQEENGGLLNVLAKGTVTFTCSESACNSASVIRNIKPVGALGTENCSQKSSLCNVWGTKQKGGTLQGTTTDAGVTIHMYGGNLGQNDNKIQTANLASIILESNSKLSINDNPTGTVTVQGNVTATESLVLRGVTVTAPNNDNWNNKSLSFVTRVTDDKEKRNVLSIVN